ncbi:hypothetical protein HYH03_014025 [Edaphochlamys debaryana]|uniref:Uncharacterized protein n=1 Tax=Edaphochlamys debaryana TaxID=47281 RepID=A0A835XNH4_9CHLO|nr:hypothetical protein HYH03_014025 [Edaphochlamys debaryana]|eukprot:KAG2487308.1 hypothetical protein HYH03_014025 [Edaphochlamys debaryana]
MAVRGHALTGVRTVVSRTSRRLDSRSGSDTDRDSTVPLPSAADFLADDEERLRAAAASLFTSHDEQEEDGHRPTPFVAAVELDPFEGLSEANDMAESYEQGSLSYRAAVAAEVRRDGDFATGSVWIDNSEDEAIQRSSLAACASTASPGARTLHAALVQGSEPAYGASLDAGDVFAGLSEATDYAHPYEAGSQAARQSSLASPHADSALGSVCEDLGPLPSPSAFASAPASPFSAFAVAAEASATASDGPVAADPDDEFYAPYTPEAMAAAAAAAASTAPLRRRSSAAEAELLLKELLAPRPSASTASSSPSPSASPLASPAPSRSVLAAEAEATPFDALGCALADASRAVRSCGLASMDPLQLASAVFGSETLQGDAAHPRLVRRVIRVHAGDHRRHH